jgi:hypothetical protein
MLSVHTEKKEPNSIGFTNVPVSIMTLIISSFLSVNEMVILVSVNRHLRKFYMDDKIWILYHKRFYVLNNLFIKAFSTAAGFITVVQTRTINYEKDPLVTG